MGGWPNAQADMLDWREAANHRPKGPAALGRSTSLKPPAVPEVADSCSRPIKPNGNLDNLTNVLHH